MKKLFGYVLIGLALVSLALPGCAPKTTKVVVATDATWPPFEYVDEQTKEIVGFDIDLMTAIAEKADIEIEFKNVAWDALLAGMAQGSYDAAISCITILPEREEKMLFSDPYLVAGQLVTVLVDNADITDKDALGGKTVGAQIGTTGSFEVAKIEGATLKTYDDIGLAYQDLMNGQIDAVIADNLLALAYVDKNPDKLKTVGEVFTEESYGIAVSKSNPELLTKINAGLAAVEEEGVLDQLVEKWLISE